MFVFTLPLKTGPSEKRELSNRVFALWRLHNRLVSHARKLMSRLDADPDYRKAKEEAAALKEKAEAGDPEAAKERKACLDAMNRIREETGLTESGLQKYAKPWQARQKDLFSSQMAQAEASAVWQGVERVLFGDGRTLNFRKLRDFDCIRGKSNANGIRFYGLGKKGEPKRNTRHRYGVLFCGLDLKVRLSEKDFRNPYAAEALSRDLKYCMVVRKDFKSGPRYYVRLVLDGDPPETLVPGTSVAGGDPGTSTFAAVSGTSVLLEEIAPLVSSYNKKIAALQRKIDRSRRKSNPGNYNPDGTVKKGRLVWKKSKTCLKAEQELRTLYRKKSAYVECDQNARANRVVKDSSVFICEKTDFAAMAKRSKKTERQEEASDVVKKDGTVVTVHKYKRKKRFGKSVSDRSPARQCSVIKRKMDQYGGFYFETDPWKAKASRYDHVTGACSPAPLSQRSKTVGGNEVQRDLYSAFLTAHTDPETNLVDRGACERDFPSFLRMQKELIAAMKADGKSRPACFGF